MSIFHFILNRFFQAIILLFVLCIIGFWIIDKIPGTYEDFLRQEEMTDQLSIEIRKEQRNPVFYFSLLPEFSQEEKNKPSEIPFIRFLPQLHWNGDQCQFHHWLTRKSYSLRDAKPVSNKIWEASMWSIVFMLPALLIIFFMGLALAEWSVKSKKTRWVNFITQLLIFFHSIPVFWLASLLIVFFAGVNFLNILPSSFVSSDATSPWEFWTTKIHYLILPLISIVLPTISVVYNLARQKYLEQMETPYWKRLIASGLSVKEGLNKEVRPHAVILLLAWIASAIPLLIGGSILIETIFGIPGTGRLLYHSITIRDWPVVHGLFLFSATLTITGVLISDLLQRRYDPRAFQK